MSSGVPPAPGDVRMVKVRRLIETPACRRFVQIEVRDFMMSERDLAKKYGVPWYTERQLLSAAWTGLCALNLIAFVAAAASS